MTIAALEATLKLYLDEKTALKEIPTLRMISISEEELREKAEKFTEIIKKSDFISEIIGFLTLAIHHLQTRLGS